MSSAACRSASPACLAIIPLPSPDVITPTSAAYACATVAGVGVGDRALVDRPGVGNGRPPPAVESTIAATMAARTAAPSRARAHRGHPPLRLLGRRVGRGPEAAAGSSAVRGAGPSRGAVANAAAGAGAGTVTTPRPAAPRA